MIKTLGQVAYEAYYHVSKGKSLISGAALPEWEQQDPKICMAWEVAAQAVRQVVRTEGDNDD